MHTLYKILIVFTVSFLSVTSFAQDRKVKFLDLLFKQGHYRKMVKKSEKLINKKGYDKHAKVYLFQAVALAKLSNNHNYTDFHPDALANSIEAYKMYFELDKKERFNYKEEKLFAVLRKFYQNKIAKNNIEEAFVFLFKDIKPIIAPKRVFIKKTTLKNIKKPLIKDTLTLKKEKEGMPLADRIIAYAETYIGVPYVYGGKSETGFDCSGYTSYVLETFGYKLPRSARDQQAKLKKIALKKAKKGDLVFFGKTKKRVTHVGLVISEQGEELTMIHASSSRGIMISNIEKNTYWKPKLISAARVLN